MEKKRKVDPIRWNCANCFYSNKKIDKEPCKGCYAWNKWKPQKTK